MARMLDEDIAKLLRDMDANEADMRRCEMRSARHRQRLHALLGPFTDWDEDGQSKREKARRAAEPVGDCPF